MTIEDASRDCLLISMREALEQSVDRMQMVQDYHDGKTQFIPSVTAAQALARKVLKDADTALVPNTPPTFNASPTEERNA